MIHSTKRSKPSVFAVFLMAALIGAMVAPGLIQPVTYADHGSFFTPVALRSVMVNSQKGSNGLGKGIGPRVGPGTENRTTIGPLNDPPNFKPDPSITARKDRSSILEITDSLQNSGATGINQVPGANQHAQPGAQSLLAKLPLSFVENRGQTHKAVHFEVKAQHHQIFFTANEIVFAAAMDINGKRKVDALSMKFDGAEKNPNISGTTRLPGKFNFFTGNDPAQWKTDVPSYSGITYKSLYRGVDLVFGDAQGSLERDFIIAPGSDPKVIQMKYDGAKQVRISQAGELVIDTPSSELTESKPLAYQTIGGQRVEVTASYKIAKDGRVGFEVGPYDQSQPLVIDPILRFSTFVGGSQGDEAFGLAVDATGIYIVGVPGVTGYPTTGTFGPVDGFNFDVFATKLTPDGTAIIYSDIIRGTARDVALATQVHPTDGSLYILTETSSADFPTTPGAFDTSFNGGQDYAVSHLNGAGNGFVWSTYIGGAGDELAFGGIDVYNNGDCWFVGGTSSLGPTQSATPFPVATTFSTTLSPTNNGGFDGVAVALKSDTGFVITSGFWGGAAVDQGAGVAINRSSLDFYYTGYTFSANAPVCINAGNPFATCQAAGFDTSYNGDRDGHITRFNNVGMPLGSTYLGDSVNAGADDRVMGVALDAANPPNIYLGGATTGPGFPTTPGAFDTSYNGGGFDQFVTKFNPTLSALVYSTFIGGSGSDPTFSGECIAVNSDGVAYITGASNSPNFPVTTSAPPSVFGGVSDATITKLNPAGNGLLLSAYIGGSDLDQAYAVRLNSAGTLATIAGFTGSANFPTTPGAFDTSFNGSFDAFVTQVDTVFDLCIQSPSDPNVLLVNAATGAFKLCSPFGTTITGTGSVSVSGCTTTINASNATIVINTCSRFGYATVTTPFGFAVIFDPNIDNNRCLCP